MQARAFQTNIHGLLNRLFNQQIALQSHTLLHLLQRRLRHMLKPGAKAVIGRRWLQTFLIADRALSKRALKIFQQAAVHPDALRTIIGQSRQQRLLISLALLLKRLAYRPQLCIIVLRNIVLQQASRAGKRLAECLALQRHLRRVAALHAFNMLRLLIINRRPPHILRQKSASLDIERAQIWLQCNRNRIKNSRLALAVLTYNNRQLRVKINIQLVIATKIFQLQSFGLHIAPSASVSLFTLYQCRQKKISFFSEKVRKHFSRSV